MVDAIEGRARAFVQVQNGCDHRCTFCIIPYGRGNSRSVPMGAVVEQVKRLAGNGYAEVVLTGVDMTSYGADLPGAPKLGKLVKTILRQVPDVKRLRLSSIDSIEADDDLLEAIATEKRLMPHLHLSLQSGDDMILKRMKRRHLRDDSIRFCEEVRDAAPRHRLRRRHHRRLPDRDRRDVREFAEDRRGVRADASPRLPVLAARGHAGRAHAAGPARGRQGARRAPARRRRSGLSRGISAALAGTRQSVLIERDGLGRTEGFHAGRARCRRSRARSSRPTITGHDGERLTAVPAADAHDRAA